MRLTCTGCMWVPHWESVKGNRFRSRITIANWNHRSSRTLQVGSTLLFWERLISLFAPDQCKQKFIDYCFQTYGILIANSLKSAFKLAKFDEQTQLVAYEFGLNLGIAIKVNKLLWPQSDHCPPIDHQSTISENSIANLYRWTVTAQWQSERISPDKFCEISLGQCGVNVGPTVALPTPINSTATIVGNWPWPLARRSKVKHTIGTIVRDAESGEGQHHQPDQHVATLDWRVGQF